MQTLFDTHRSSQYHLRRTNDSVLDALVAIVILVLLLVFFTRTVGDRQLSVHRYLAETPLFQRNTVKSMQPSQRALVTARSPRHEYQAARDLYAFFARHTTAGVHRNPEALYFASQVLEECFDVSRLSWEEYFAARAASNPVRELAVCEGFVGNAIHGADIVALLDEAAAAGDNRAQARMLLFRDIGAPMDEMQAQIETLLATGDAYVLRDVEAYLGRRDLAQIAASNPQTETRNTDTRT